MFSFYSLNYRNSCHLRSHIMISKICYGCYGNKTPQMKNLAVTLCYICINIYIFLWVPQAEQGGIIKLTGQGGVLKTGHL